jgi:hypothetical protein
MPDPKWIRFVERDTPDGLKTKRWFVFSIQGNDLLGTVSWFGRWRKYVFTPMLQTVFEEDCLRDIAVFLELATRVQMDQAAARRAERLMAGHG